VRPFALLLFAATALAEPLARKIDDAAQPVVDSGAVVGFAVAAVAPGTEVLKGYGRIAKDAPARPTADTVYEIGSVSKVFTGVLLASMARDGLVKLEQPVSGLLPESVRMPKGERAITLLDLATHASGLPRMPDNFAPKDPKHPYVDYSAELMYAFLSGHALRRQPGAEYEYSNLGMGLLGHALAREAGKGYEDLLHERITGPLGMTSTVVALGDEMRARLAPGHDARGTRVPSWDIPTLAGAGGIRSTARDMLRFLKANLADEGAVPEACAAARGVRFEGSARIGLGWHVQPNGYHWHNGQTGGYHAFLALDAGEGAGVVVLSNTASAAADQLGAQIMNLLLGKDRREVEIAAEVLALYAGTYRIQPGFDLTITHEDGKLMAQATGQPKFQVFAESKTRFFWKVVDAQLTFHVGEDGEVAKCTLHQGGRDIPCKRVE